MFNYIFSLVMLLAQTEKEKSITIVGLAFFAGFIFFLIMDTTIKGKFVPKKGPVKYFLIFLFILILIILIMLYIFNK